MFTLRHAKRGVHRCFQDRSTLDAALDDLKTGLKRAEGDDLVFVGEVVAFQARSCFIAGEIDEFPDDGDDEHAGVPDNPDGVAVKPTKSDPVKIATSIVRGRA